MVSRSEGGRFPGGPPHHVAPLARPRRRGEGAVAAGVAAEPRERDEHFRRERDLWGAAGEQGRWARNRRPSSLSTAAQKMHRESRMMTHWARARSPCPTLQISFAAARRAGSSEDEAALSMSSRDGAHERCALLPPRALFSSSCNAERQSEPLAAGGAQGRGLLLLNGRRGRATRVWADARSKARMPAWQCVDCDQHGACDVALAVEEKPQLG